MVQSCIQYLMYKLDSVSQDRQEPWQTEVCHLLHDGVRVHLKTPASDVYTCTCNCNWLNETKHWDLNCVYMYIFVFV